MTWSALAFPVILIAIVLAMYAAMRVLRSKLGIGAGTVGSDSLRIVGKRQLDPRKALYVVEVADRYILVGAAEQSLSLIDHITADEYAVMIAPAAGDATTGSSFAALLQRAKAANSTLADKRAAARGRGKQTA